MVTLWMSLLFTAPAPVLAPNKPAVDVEVLGADRLLVRSQQPIESVNLSELSEWCSYFICYSPDCRKVTILIRTRQTPLRLVVETRNPVEFGMRQRHEVQVKNPWAFRHAE